MLLGRGNCNDLPLSLYESVIDMIAGKLINQLVLKK